jgi:hypothetical protein
MTPVVGVFSPSFALSIGDICLCINQRVLTDETHIFFASDF